MTAAAIVCGNTVVLKPSSDAAMIAAWFVDLLDEVGVPPGVVNFIPGSGSEIGDLIVTHPQIRFISFTGSKEIGLRINELAAKPQTGQKWIKRVVAEMGGKDSIIVSADADLDAAVEGVAVSAFGFQGQKCSACSRAIVEEPHLRRVPAAPATPRRADHASAIRGIRANFMGPVVNESALASIMSYIEKGQSEGRLISGGERVGCERLLHRADGHRRRRARRNDRSRGDLRTGPGGDQSQGFRRCAWRSPTTPSSV